MTIVLSDLISKVKATQCPGRIMANFIVKANANVSHAGLECGRAQLPILVGQLLILPSPHPGLSADAAHALPIGLLRRLPERQPDRARALAGVAGRVAHLDHPVLDDLVGVGRGRVGGLGGGAREADLIPLALEGAAGEGARVGLGADVQRFDVVGWIWEGVRPVVGGGRDARDALVRVDGRVAAEAVGAAGVAVVGQRDIVLGRRASGKVVGIAWVGAPVCDDKKGCDEED